jgi:hypothetical protein
MKRVAGESEPVVVVPLIVEPVEVGITLGVIPPHVRHMTLVLEGTVQDAFLTTAYRIFSKLYRVWDHNPPAPCTEYLHFLK